MYFRKSSEPKANDELSSEHLPFMYLISLFPKIMAKRTPGLESIRYWHLP